MSQEQEQQRPGEEATAADRRSGLDDRRGSGGPGQIGVVVPKKFCRATIGGYVWKDASQRAMLEAVNRWIGRVKTGGAPMLALTGATGNGKTHLLYAAVRQLGAEGRTVVHRPWYLLLQEFRLLDHAHGWHGLHEVYGADVVCVDGVVPPSPGASIEDDELTKLALYCYDEQVSLLLTSSERLSALVGPAIVARFQEAVVSGPDFRELKRVGGSAA